MTETPLGIDIAKRTCQVSVQVGSKRRHRSFANDGEGHAELLAWLARLGIPRVHAALEATGTYGEALATALSEAGHVVSVVNPAAVNAFAASQLRRTKTDRVDADVLLEFVVAHQPPAWTPWPAEVRVLQGLVRRIEAVQDMLTQERNRLAAGGLVPVVMTSLTRHIAMLDAELVALEAQVRTHLEQHPRLRAQRDLLITIPGIGVATVARLLAECRDIRAFDSARAYAAFSGLVPRARQSGTLVGRAHLAKVGSARLRRAMYFPALAAARHNPVLRAFRTKLLAAGKHKMVIVAAVMRKLLHTVYGVLKSEKPFDASLAKA